MALAFADTISASVTAHNTGSMTLTNVTVDDIVLVFFIWERTQAAATWRTISSISGGGFTWAQRSGFQISSNDGVPHRINVEMWWARATSSPGSMAITVNWTGVDGPSDTDDVEIAACRVTGIPSALGSPWDPDASLPKKQDGSSTVASAVTTSGVSTTRSNTMIIGLFGSSSFGLPTVGTGYTQVISAANGGGANNASLFVQEQVFSAAQTNITVATAAAPTRSRWGWIVDALTSDTGTASAVAAQTVPAFTQTATAQTGYRTGVANQTVPAFTQNATAGLLAKGTSSQNINAFTNTLARIAHRQRGESSRKPWGLMSAGGRPRRVR